VLLLRPASFRRNHIVSENSGIIGKARIYPQAILRDLLDCLRE
jgi:hypothetical protein